ncbi:hypothetical protein LXL04_018697 [Taraxacum kok-saghyz]
MKRNHSLYLRTNTHTTHLPPLPLPQMILPLLFLSATYAASPDLSLEDKDPMYPPSQSWLPSPTMNYIVKCTTIQPHLCLSNSKALYANTSISTGMKGATKAMVAMNKYIFISFFSFLEMAPAKQVKVIKEFQKQSSQLDMTIEMMSESIDETLDKDEAEEETEELTNQVLDEIGVGVFGV